MSDLGYPQILPRSENWSKTRTRKIQIVTHCTATAYADNYPTNLGRYWAREVTRTSTQYAVSDTQVVQYVPHWATAFGTRMPGNANAIHVEFIGLVTYTRKQWLAHDAMLRRGAKLYVEIMRKEPGINFNFYRNLTNAELAAGKSGVFTHLQHTQVFSGTHTDPGPGFPHDVLWKYIKEILEGGEEDMALSNEDIERIWAHKVFPDSHGWLTTGIANSQVYLYLSKDGDLRKKFDAILEGQKVILQAIENLQKGVTNIDALDDETRAEIETLQTQVADVQAKIDEAIEEDQTPEPPPSS